MKQPLWKRALSYITELHIESAPSEINPHLYVSLRDGRYQLCTDNAIYSYEDKYTNFVQAFRQLPLDKMKIDKVLILGFGLGSIPFILEQSGYQYRYTGVEIDDSVLYLANKYTLDKINAPLELIQANALPFVWQCHEQYDMICMDIFQDAVVPKEFETVEYLQRLKELLTPNGILLYNRLTALPEHESNTFNFYIQRFKKVFSEARTLKLGGNWMLVGK